MKPKIVFMVAIYHGRIVGSKDAKAPWDNRHYLDFVLEKLQVETNSAVCVLPEGYTNLPQEILKHRTVVIDKEKNNKYHGVTVCPTINSVVSWANATNITTLFVIGGQKTYSSWGEKAFDETYAAWIAEQHTYDVEGDEYRIKLPIIKSHAYEKFSIKRFPESLPIDKAEITIIGYKPIKKTSDHEK